MTTEYEYDDDVDLSRLTDAQRASVRRQLDAEDEEIASRREYDSIRGEMLNGEQHNPLPGDADFGKHPNAAAVEASERRIAAGGTRAEGMADAFDVLFKAGARGDKRVIHTPARWVME